MIIDELKFNDQGLIPAIIQDEENKEVLMLAYMNRESLHLTLQTGKCTYFSRSRNKLWLKGETSGNFQHVKHIFYDCDADTLLIQVRQTGVACHTGERSCFFRQVPAT
jgi:phosphoribosyl-AMP cyclohydrolase